MREVPSTLPFASFASKSKTSLGYQAATSLPTYCAAVLPKAAVVCSVVLKATEPFMIVPASAGDIKLAIFDLGNVAFRVNWGPMFALWGERAGIEPSVLGSRFAFNECFEAFERGEISPEIFHRRMSEAMGMEISFDDFVSGWNAIYGEPLPGFEEALKRAREKVTTAAFSNTNVLHCEIWPTRYDAIVRHFDRVFVSSELRVRKPEPEGFRRVLADCGAEPREAVFFDDFPPNVEAARAIGLRAFLVDTPRVVPEELERLGLL
jgi:putative hydrolase of the HAD superfamily